ncbi:potassium channel family protein [Mycolicibacterium litorale]|uniref:potassium channel family protein n=1 Tax=Mycolicibacterium litorale TaxID=758802 RepID=UPI001F30A63B|nr:potassium channel family protein [Mycolicibacterium litorale]
MTDDANRPQRLDAWERRVEWPLAAVAVVFLGAYAVDVLAEPKGFADFAVGAVTAVSWVIFALDYFIRLSLAPDRWRWFYRHLFDLAMVLLPLLRPLRLLRLVILISVLQRAVGNAIRGRVVTYTVSAAVLLVFVASLAVLENERYAPEAKITGFGEALWWSITTITTVGYGDITPVTTAGRWIAVLLMIGGISLVGSITATLASWIVQRVADEDSVGRSVTTEHIDMLLAEIDALRGEVRSLRGQQQADSAPGG